jgi:hypothetical protein
MAGTHDGNSTDSIEVARIFAALEMAKGAATWHVNASTETKSEQLAIAFKTAYAAIREAARGNQRDASAA